MRLSFEYTHVLTREAKKKKKDKNNPWAICHHSTGPGKTKHFEDCVQDVKKKTHYHD